MPREISGLRIAKSFISPTNAEVSRVIDFQLGARQGIAISAVLGGIMVDPNAFTPSTSTILFLQGTHTLHLEAGSLETVPDEQGEDEDTIDSEIFYRQEISVGGNDDVSTEFRASLTVSVTPSGIVPFAIPILTARNITHRGINPSANLDTLCHVIIYYTFVEFTLAELGLILARRT